MTPNSSPSPSARLRDSVASMAMLSREYRVMFEIEEDYWWYRGLRALIVELLELYVPRDRRARLLDAGCGTGANLRLLAQHGEAWGVDIAEEAIRFCHQRGLRTDRTLLASLLELPFPDRFFDLAVSFDVICNIEDDVSAFAELRRVLAPGGRLITQLPAFRFLWSAHDVAVGHKHRYTARTLSERIERAGLRVERLTFLNMLLFPLVAAARLLRRPAAQNGHAHSDLVPLPGPLNAALTRIFTAEMRAAARHQFPYGVSLLVIARRD